MDIATSGLSGQRLYLGVVIILSLGAAIAIGMMIGNDAVLPLVFLFGIIASFAWAAFAGERWWVLVPAAGAIGGYFYFGHKIYTNEVAFLACLAPLAAAVAIRAPGIAKRRPFHLPVVVYLLTGYLAIHWLGSNIYNKMSGDPGYGNVARVYLTAVGVLVFVLLFQRYGSARYIPLALLLTYLAASFRVVAGLIIYFTDRFAYIPVINYVLPGSTHSGSDDLRNSGLILLSVSLCYFLFRKGSVPKILNLLMLLVSFVAIVVGAGRVIMLLAGAMLLFAALLYRKIVPLALCIAALVGVVAVLNFNPNILNRFEPRVQRAFSILLLDQQEAAYYGRALSSDQWHEDLRKVGYAKWTQSWNTVLFGCGIRPVGTQFLAFIPNETTEEDVLEAASKVGSYESGWWTVLAVTGVAGMVLYVAVLLFLLGKLLPILVREKVRDHSHAFAFIAAFGIINWIFLGWGNGSFPSTEILFAFLGFIALKDRSVSHAPAIRSLRNRTLATPLEPRTPSVLSAE